MPNKKQIRAHFREACFKRDKDTCVMCGAGDSLTVHHITNRNDMPNGGYVAENGITVCPECHIKAEHFFVTGEALEGFHPDDLYSKIGSSEEKARQASLKLKE